jgi:hypothetical protein
MLSPKGHSEWTASKRLSAEGRLLEGSRQGIDPARKDVGNCKGQKGHALGRSRGGFTTKIHLKTDFNGHMIAF